MITGIDSIVVISDDPSRGRADYLAALGGEPTGGGGSRLQLENVAIVFQAAGTSPEEGDGGARLKLVLAAADVEATVRRLGRRGLVSAYDGPSGSFNLDIKATHGVPIGVTGARAAANFGGTADIAGLDHVVIRTPDPERAVALYGGRLGLDLRLDRSNADLGSRMLFFVCGGLVVEITHDLRKGTGDGADRLWGLAWRARNVDRAHARMRSHGIDVSEIRAGRRPGTRVFTLKSHVAGVPTLVIGGDDLDRK